MKTVQAYLPTLIRRLKEADHSAPRLDAQLWLGHVCGISRAQLLAHPERVLLPDEVRILELGLERLIDGEPLPYLTGRTEFYGLEFEVTPDVLIPRPETEHLVDAAIERAKELAHEGTNVPLTIVDVGTGSGCVAVSLAVNLPIVRVTAIDVSSTALAVAARNADRHRVSEQLVFRHGSLLEPQTEPVHLIVANLPYIADDEWSGLSKSVSAYEPVGALRGGKEGLDLIHDILHQAPPLLMPGGSILLEIGATQGKGALELGRLAFPTAKIQLVQDYAGRDRLLAIDTIRLIGEHAGAGKGEAA